MVELATSSRDVTLLRRERKDCLLAQMTALALVLFEKHEEKAV